MDQVTPNGKQFLKSYHDKFIAKMEPRRGWKDDQQYLEHSLKTFLKLRTEIIHKPKPDPERIGQLLIDDYGEPELFVHASHVNI